MFKQVFVKEMKPSSSMMQVLASYERAVAPIIEDITLQQWEDDALQTPTTELLHSVFSSPKKYLERKLNFSFACATTIKWNLAIMVAVTPPICTFCLKKKINKRNKILFPAFPHLYQNTSFSIHGSLTRDYATKGHQQVFAKSSSALFS